MTRTMTDDDVVTGTPVKASLGDGQITSTSKNHLILIVYCNRVEGVLCIRSKVPKAMYFHVFLYSMQGILVHF